MSVALDDIQIGRVAVAVRKAIGRRQKDRLVKRRILDVVVLMGRERVLFEELDPCRKGTPRSYCTRKALAVWADQVLVEVPLVAAVLVEDLEGGRRVA